MSSINLNLQNGNYDIKVSMNSDGSRSYELSKKVYVKKVGEADLNLKLTEDEYGNFINASISGTVVKNLAIAEFSLSVGGEAIVNQKNVVCNLEAKADLLVEEIEVLTGNSSIPLSELKMKIQIPISNLKNGHLDNIEISGSAEVLGVSTSGPETWAQDILWSEWNSMSSEQKAQAISNGYGPLTKSWSENLKNKSEQYETYMDKVIGEDLENADLEYFDGKVAVLETENGKKIVFDKTDEFKEKYVLDKDGKLETFERLNKNGEFEKFNEKALENITESQVKDLVETVNKDDINKEELRNCIENIDKSSLSTPTEVGVVSLKEGQTISHVAAKTKFTSVDLLEYNNLTHEEAKSLPIGFKVQIPKDVHTTTGEYGNIKIFENFNEGGSLIAPNELGIKETIHYSENSDLLIKGDITNPNEISFTNSKGEFEVWKKDSMGTFYEATKQTDNFTIYYEKNGTLPKSVSKISGIIGEVTLENIASYTEFNANELKSFNYLDIAIDEKITSIDILTPSSKTELYFGDNGSITSMSDVFGNEQLMLKSKDGKVSTYDATEFTYENTSDSAYKIDISPSLGDDRTIVFDKSGEYFDTSYINKYVGEISDVYFSKNSQGDYALKNLSFKNNGISIEDSVKASAYVYGDSKAGLPEGWTLIDHSRGENGFYAEAYKTPNGDIVFAMSGTNDLSDLNDDAQLTLLKDTDQKKNAIELIDRVLKEHSFENIHFTGHSLGGHLAQEGMYHILTNEKYIDKIPSDKVSGMGFNAPGYGEKPIDEANFISINSTTDPVNLAGGGRISEHELFVNTGKILDHSMNSLLDYILENPLIGEYTTNTFHSLTKEERLLIEQNDDAFIVKKIEEWYDDPQKFLNMPDKLKQPYYDAKANVSIDEFFNGKIDFDKVIVNVERSPKTMLSLKAELENKGNDDVASHINSDGTWNEDTPKSMMKRAFLEKTEGQANSTQIASTIGGQIGSIIVANNDFSNVEKILVNTATTTIAQNIGESIYWEDKGGVEGADATTDIKEDALNNLKGAVVSFAVSSYFAKNDNISDILGMDGTFLGGYLDQEVSNTIAFIGKELITSGTIDWANFNPGSALGGYLGNLAANELMGWDTKEESMGASVGSAIGSMVTILLTNPATFWIGVLYAFGGSFIGNIVGGILGGLFGGGTPPPPKADALFEFDEETQTYTLISSGSSDGGNEAAMKSMGENFAKQLINMFAIPGGQLVNADAMPDISVTQNDKLIKINGYRGSFDTVEEMISHALSVQIPFINVEGGDPYLLRAINRTNDKFLEGDPNAETGRADVKELYENISLAQDYSKYQNETILIVDSKNRVIEDSELLKEIDSKYKEIMAIEDESEQKTAMEEFSKQYRFLTHKQYVDELLEEVTVEHIEAYKTQRNKIINNYDEKISEASEKINSLYSEVETLNKQLQSAAVMYESEHNKEKKEQISQYINSLSSQKNLLLNEKVILEEKIENLANQKEETLAGFDEKYFREVDAIHWNNVFEKAEELQLDEHHYSEDFNKLNTEISKYNYDLHEENGELLEIDYDDLLSQVANKALEVYKMELAKENEDEEKTEESKLAVVEEVLSEENKLSKDEAISILKELGYDFEKSYEENKNRIKENEKPKTFEEFLESDSVLSESYQGETELSVERIKELLNLTGIDDPSENFEIADDAFSFSGKSLNDLQFELKDGKLIITTFDKDLERDKALEKSQKFVVENWEKWDKENTHLDLPNGTKVNLNALLEKIGVKEGEGVVDVSEAFNKILEEDETLSSYMDKFEDKHTYISTSLDDKINAFFGDNLVVSTEGNNEVNTGSGSDTIIAGTGKEKFSTGLGIDTVSYEKSESSVIANLETGGVLGDAKEDSYEGVENLVGSKHNDSLSGNSSDNVLKGNDGNDTLSGKEGADTLDGGEGIDIADYQESAGAVEINLEENYAAKADAQGDSFVSIEGVSGSNNSDTIVVDANANIVFGQDGNDRISAQGGNDIVHGGKGSDYIKGGSGNDELSGDEGDDTLIGGTGDDTLKGGEGKNVLEGGVGTDIAVYKGLSKDFEIMFVNDNTLLIRSKDGKINDTLKDIEEIAFDDAVFAIDYTNKVLSKKAEFELTEEDAKENDDVNNENSGSNQASAIATAAMIGTVAAAETVEISSEDENYLSNNPENEENQETETVKDKNPIVVQVINKEDSDFEAIEKIKEIIQPLVIETSVENEEVVENIIEEDNIENRSSVVSDKKETAEVEIININNIKSSASLVADTEINEVKVLEKEKELPELLIPIINLLTNITKEDEDLLGIQISNPNANSTINVIITGIPQDVLLSAGEQRGEEWHLQQKDLKDLKLIPAHDNANDFDIKIEATVTDIHGRVIQNVLNERIIIEAVADTPNFNVVNYSNGLEDTYIPLNVTTSLNDIVGGEDGEESIILTFENIPDDAILTAGRKDLESGTWFLKPKELVDLKVKAGTHVGDDFTIKITSFSIESENNSIASISDEIYVKVNAVADTPILEVNDSKGNEDTQIALDISTTFVDKDGSELMSIEIENIPPNASLNKGFKDENGVWHLTRAELGNLFLTPTLHDAQDFTIKVTALTKEQENGNIAKISKDIDITIDAVADSVALDLTQELTSKKVLEAAEDASISYLNIKSDFIDKDGSESIHYLIEGLPEGTTLNHGEEVETGKWKVLPDQLEDLGIFLKENSDKDFRLKVSAITTEEENSNQKVTVEYIDCNVESVADYANLDVSNASGFQNDFINLDIKSSLVDTDGSETLEVIIEQVPEKALLNKGTKDSSGNWHLKPEELEGLTIRPEFNSIVDMELKVKAVTTEKKNGATQESIAYLKVNVDEIPSDASLIINATEVNEDEECLLDIKVDPNSLNSTDSIYLEIDIPKEFSLSSGEKLSDTKWKLREDDLENLSLKVTPNFAGSLFLNIVPVILESSGNVRRSPLVTKLPVDIIPIADEPTLEVEDIVSDEDRIVYFDIKSKLKDLDGSESLTLEIEGIPEDAILNAGEKVGNIWVIKENEIDILALLPSEDMSGVIDLKVKAISIDSNNDKSEVTKNMSITINEVVDKPILNLADAFIKNGEAILTLDAKLKDIDNSESLTIEIGNLPEDATLNNGVLNDDGTYTLSKSDLDGLKIIGLKNETFALNIKAKSNDFEVIEKELVITKQEDQNPILFDRDSLEYKELISKLDAVDSNADIEVEINGIPNEASLNYGVKDIDGRYSLSKEEFLKLRVEGADGKNLNLDVKVTAIKQTNFEPITKNLNISVENSDEFTLNDNDIFSLQFQDILSKTVGKEVVYELSGFSDELVLIPEKIKSEGIYTFSKEELESLKIKSTSSDINLSIKAVISPLIETENIDSSIDVSVLETREKPYLKIESLSVLSTTKDGEEQSFSDAEDTVKSGGGNDKLYTNSGNDTIYSDESDGRVNVSFNLDSTTLDKKADEKLIYKIENLPMGTTSNIGYLNNGVLIIEADDLSGALRLSYPYQKELLKLNISSNLVNETDINTYLATSYISLKIDGRDISGSDYIDSGEMNDIIDSGDKDDIVLGKSGNDTIFSGKGNDFVDGGKGADRFSTGAGDDKIVMDYEDFDNNKFITEIVNAGEGFDTVIIKDDKGVNFDMELTNVESFVGGDGNDNVIGSNSEDIVKGGRGADSFFTKGGNDTIYIDAEDIKAQSGDFIDAGEGYDKIFIEDSNGVNFDVANTNAEEITAGLGDDILRNSTNEKVSIYGAAGNDTIFASNSEDVLDGGEGIDTIDFSNSTVGVNVNLETNTVSSGYAQGDTISNFENIVGTNSDDNLVGNDTNNIFEAKEGNNIIDGKGGEDSVVFEGNLIDYFNGKEVKNIVTNFDGTATVFTKNGITEVSNISKLKFNDYEVYIDGTANSPYVYKDILSTQEDTTVTVNAQELLSNDFSLENSELKIVEVKNAENGIVTLNDGGTISFKPYDNYNSSTNNTFDKNSKLYKGEAGFEYVVEDINGNRSSAFTTVEVSAVNDAPTISSHVFYRRSYYTGRGKFVLEDVDNDVSALNLSVVSNLTYTTTGRTYYDWWGRGEGGRVTPTFSRTGYVNVNGRTPNDEGEFYFDYRGSYIGGHHYRTGWVDIFDMRPFVVKISDSGDLNGDNVQSITVTTGTYYHLLRSDPIVIDLDGDGVELKDKFYESFDDTLLGVGKDDAVLVWDIDQSGTINSQLETDWVGISSTATNDLEALREKFDTNNDGLFNVEDDDWKNFALWQDKNEDGLVSDGEFTKIKDSQIEQINLETNKEKEANNPIVEYASYTNKDGEINEIAATYLDTTSTNEKLSEEDKLIIKQAILLNEQIAAKSESNSNSEQVVVFDESQIDENIEEFIA